LYICTNIGNMPTFLIFKRIEITLKKKCESCQLPGGGWRGVRVQP